LPVPLAPDRKHADAETAAHPLREAPVAIDDGTTSHLVGDAMEKSQFICGKNDVVPAREWLETLRERIDARPGERAAIVPQAVCQAVDAGSRIVQLTPRHIADGVSVEIELPRKPVGRRSIFAERTAPAGVLLRGRRSPDLRRDRRAGQARPQIAGRQEHNGVKARQQLIDRCRMVAIGPFRVDQEGHAQQEALALPQAGQRFEFRGCGRQDAPVQSIGLQTEGIARERGHDLLAFCVGAQQLNGGR
jgi:hypothetical protein